ncbi:amino acid adenylation domain-containing protein [Streptomyces sp. NBC_01716]|uniref:amino acid adenylation domain-containing protein n=1 Tax=Streptomyces sp. NBC_01716 TaxID=2975917 RepID=UPI002E345685|nr:amino acid adenylation domain-containing protein [Streptomyces sp. NBC_01716]
MRTPDTRVDEARLLAAQEGIWTGHHLDLDSPAYNTAEYVEIHGPVDTAVFGEALRRVVSETQALNVRFDTVDGQPRQITRSVAGWRPHISDLTDRSSPSEAALAWMRRDLARPVDLRRDLVFGHALFRIGPDHFLWYHRVHHIALDGFGLALVARRVAAVYTALVGGERIGDSGFGTLASVRSEERAYRESERFAQDRAYWAGRFADRPSVAALAERPALPARTFLRRVTDLGTEQSAALRAVAQRLSVTWSDIVLSVTAAYLRRATNEDEIVLSLPVMGRLGSVSLRVPCMVRNILPLRVTVREGDSLRDLATRVSGELRSGLPHQRYRYEQMRRDLQLVGGGRRLSGLGVNIMPFEYDLRFAGHRSTVHNLSAGPVDDMAINVYDRAEGAGLRIAVDANPELYAETELTRHQQGFLSLLRMAVAEPDSALGAPARSRTVTVLDGGPLSGPARPVLKRIADHAARRGGAPAVEHDGSLLTYAELFGSARRLARRLTARGAGPGTVVAVALPRGIDLVTTVLGVLLCGAAYCPLDPRAPASRTEAMLADTEPSVTVTTGAHAMAVPHGELLLLDRDEDTRPPVADEPAGPGPFAGSPGPDALAYVMYTSGSTGRPKGVDISHGALAHFVAGASDRYGLRPEDRVLQFAPPHFDTSVEEIFLTLCAGATLVVRTDDMTESVPRLMDACATLRISFLDLPTAYWHELAHALSTGSTVLPDAIHTVVIGGEAALPERVDRWRRTVRPSVRLLNTYGPTEATVVATVAELHDEALPALPPGDVPIGVPLPGTRAAVVGDELYLLGDALALGYHGRRTPDGERFAPLGQLTGAPRAYRTGDLVRLGDDGQLRFTGRADNEFKISGHRVHPAEIETALLGDPSVREAAVVGDVLPDGTRRLAAYVVTEPGGRAEGHDRCAARIRGRLRATLPAAVIPALIEFVARLPRTSSGKIDRNALGAEARERRATVPSQSGSLLERAIQTAWGTTLGTDAVSPHDDFFDLGGQSLQAIQVANRLGIELAREVRVAWLFEYPTAAELAAFLTRRQQVPTAGPFAASSLSALPPSASPLSETARDDAVLDQDIRPRATTPGVPSSPRRILLTGATGFVGAHLLAELLARTDAEIICPVRAPSPRRGSARILKALRELRIAPPGDRARITAIPADLARPRLGLGSAAFAGLADGCDAIFHNAATVSIMREYTSLRGVNVESTRQLLRIAAERGTPFHLISTLSTAPPRSSACEVPEEFFAPHNGLAYGYQQSKWVAERLAEQAAERGLPVSVHRLGRVTGAPATGVVNERDFLWSVLRAGIPAGMLPDLFESEIWTPADYVAKAVVAISLGTPPPGGEVYHHAPAPAQVRLSDVYAWVGEFGYDVKRMPLDRWRAQLPRTADVAATTLAFFDSWGTTDDQEPELAMGGIRSDNANRKLRGTGIICPPISQDLMFRYLARCVSTGALPAPRGGGGPPASGDERGD